MLNDETRVCDVIMHYLCQCGVAYIFGITGKTISPLFDATYNYPIRPIMARHEEGAAFMAYGYAQMSKMLGVCCGTSSPGAMNLMAGVASAYMNSVPMLVITGQVPMSDFGKGGFQEATNQWQSIGRSVDVVSMFSNVTKMSRQIIDPQKAPEIIRSVIKMAMTGRQGPVHLSIPIDVNLSKIKLHAWKNNEFLPANKQMCDLSALESALNLIEQAEKPVFLLGWGTILANGSSTLLKLAEHLNIPVVTTPQGKGGIPTNHPLCLGVMGLCGNPSAINYIFEEADLLIAVGTSFGEFTTLNWDPKVATNKKLLQIDIDPMEIGKNYRVNVGLVGDAELILEQLFKMSEKKLRSKKFQALSSDRWDTNKYYTPEQMTSTAIPLNPQRVMKELRDSTPDNTIFLADSGSHWGWATHNLPIYKNGMFFPSLGLGSMGAGICSAIGIRLSSLDAPVVCICGDGSFQMNGNEIGTAAYYKIPVIWIIMNDGRYNMPFYGTIRLYGRGEEMCDLMKVDFVRFASSFGIKGYCVKKPGELTDVMSNVLSLKEPAVIDVHIDKNIIAPVGNRLNYGGKRT